MKIVLAPLVMSVLGVAALVVPSGASTTSSTGDICVVTGSGTAYTVTIRIPVDAPAQAGFAFGAPGVTVMNAVISAGRGTFSSKNLPADTTGGWIMSIPSLTGAVMAKLVTSGPVSGSFTVVPASKPGGTYFDPISCPISTRTAPSSGVLEAQERVSYQPATGTWLEVVTVSGPGKVVFRQGVSHNAGTTSPPPKSLLRSGSVVAKHAGKVTLTLKPTAAGRAALNATHMIKLRLSITFESLTGATPATKVLNVTLRTT